MITFSVKGVRVDLLFSFFVIIAITSLGASEEIAVSLLCCIFHEAGHLMTMLYYKRKPNAICLYGGGIRIKAPFMRLSPSQEAAIYAAGPLTNLLLFLSALVLGQQSSLFAQANLVLCVFNLLPFEHLDGGKLADSLAITSGLWYNALKFFRILVGGFLAATVIYAFFKGVINVVLLATLSYLVVSEYLS